MYAEQLLDLDTDALSVAVTHMDTVKWSQSDLIRSLNSGNKAVNFFTQEPDLLTLI